MSRWSARLRDVPSWIRSRIGATVWLRTCTRVGSGVRTFWRPIIVNEGRMEIGDRVRLNSHWVPIELVSGPQGLVEIADRVYINYGSMISAQRRVRIGAGCMIGNHCIIADTETPGTGGLPAAPGMDPRPVEIGDGAWLAARVTVLPGARIGAGAVIAAGSVVAGEIPAGAIAGGIPARVLRQK